MLILIVSSGPDKGAVYELHDDRPVVIGRDGDPIRLDDRKASRHHARLSAQAGQWFLQDLDSRHGTFLNSISVGAQPEKLSDGDRIRVGNTQLVLARVPMELAERGQLLGEPATEKQARQAVRSGGGVTRKAAVAAAAAVTLIVGVNVYSLIQSSSNARELRAQIAAVDRPDDVQPMLRDILAAVENRPDRAAILADVKAALADQPDPRAQLDAILARVDAQSQQGSTLDAILTKVDEQAKQGSTLEAILARVDEQAARARGLDELREAVTAQQSAAGEAAVQMRDQLALVLTKLNESPAEAAGHPADDEVRRQLALVLEKLDAQPQPTADPQTLAKLDAVLARLDAPRTESPMIDPAIRAGLAQVLEKLDAPAAPLLDEDALARKVAGEVLVAGAEERRTLQRLALEAAAQRQVAAQLDELRAMVAAQPQATRTQIDEALAQLNQGDDTRRVLAAVESVRAALPADATDKLDAVLARLDAQSAAGGSVQVAEALQSLVAQQGESQQASLAALRGEIQKLADAQRTTPDAIIGELHAALAARSDADAKLAESLELAAARPRTDERTEQLLQQVLGELRSRSTDNDAVAGILRELRDKSIADMTELRQTLRTELEAHLARSSATAAAPTPQPAVTVAAAEPTPTIIGQTEAAPRVPMASALLGEETAASDATSDGLTRTERAYKLAFETGQPVTIGSGQLNPITGVLSEGRTLDPRAAKAAGIRSWRDWYLMDDYAERMRLQQQARRFRQDNPSNSDVIALPPTTTP